MIERQERRRSERVAAHPKVIFPSIVPLIARRSLNFSTIMKYDLVFPDIAYLEKPSAHTRRAPTVVLLRVHNPNLRRQGVRCLLVLAEEVVVSSIRHEPLVTYVGGGAATVGVVGGRPTVGV